MGKKEVNIKGGRSEIIMWLDDYVDLFSDFDPRPLSERALSYDFLDETKRASKEKDEKIKFNLLIPRSKRKVKTDHVVKKRLREHFTRHYKRHRDDAKRVLKRGLWLCFVGIILMFVATYVLFYFQKATFWMSFFVVLLEPAGWFLFWEGLDMALFTSKKEKPLLEFYKKMANSRLIFSSY